MPENDDAKIEVDFIQPHKMTEEELEAWIALAMERIKGGAKEIEAGTSGVGSGEHNSTSGTLNGVEPRQDPEK